MKVIDKYPFESFIGSYEIDKSICDELIDYYKKNNHLITRGTFAEGKINLNEKDSYEVGIKYNDVHYPINLYQANLQLCLNEYIKKYEPVNMCRPFGIVEDYHIQYYNPGGGYKIWHNERGGSKVANRYLVFMTYLNDVEDGGTEFLYQKIKTKAEKGLTLIWPTEWTHHHRGIISDTNEKYIISGRWSFINE